MTVQFNASSYMVNETAGSLRLNLTLSSVSSVPVIVSYRTTNGTALAGIGFNAASGNVTFSPGQVNKTVTIYVRNDNRFSESSRLFFVNLTAAYGASLGPEPYAAITLEETSLRPTIGFNISTYYARENATSAEIRVSLSGAAADPVDVDYSTSDGTALDGDDYHSVAGSLHFDPGTLYKTFTVDILNDSLYGANEVFYVNLTNLQGTAVFGSRQNANVTILETSPRPVLALSNRTIDISEDAGSVTLYAMLSGGVETPVKVNVTTANYTARAGLDYVPVNTTLQFSPGETIIPVTVTLMNDGLYSLPDKNFTVRLSTVSGPVSWGSPTTTTITLIETGVMPVLSLNRPEYVVNESVGRINYNVTLTGGVSSPVSVNVSTTNGTALAGTDYSRVAAKLTFQPGEQTKTVTIWIRNDSTYDPFDKQFTLDLTSITCPAIPGEILHGTVTILEGSACPTVRLNRSMFAVRENATAAVIGVLMSGRTSSPVVIYYTAMDGTAVAGRDYSAAGSSVTISPGQTSAYFAVDLIDDGAYGYPNKYFFVNVTGVAGTAGIGSQPNTTVTVIENGLRPVLQFNSSIYYITEEGENVTLNVTLSGIADAPVTVNYTTANNTARAGINYVARSGTLVFGPGETSKQITVTVMNDSLYSVPDKNFTVRLSGVSGPASAGIRSVAVVNLYELNAVPVIDFEIDGCTVNENAGTVRLNVTKTGSPAGTIRVNYSTGDGTALAGRDYTATSGTLSFAQSETRKTIMITILRDTSFNYDRAFFVNLSSPTGGATLGGFQSISIGLREVDPAPVVQFGATTVEVNSTDGTATLTVTKTGSTKVNASVAYATADDTAIAGVNYVATSGMLTFLPEETVKTLTVPILKVPGVNSSFNVALSPFEGASIGAADMAAIDIIGNQLPIVQFSATAWDVSEEAALVSLNVTKTGYGACSVRISTRNGTALAGLNYTALDNLTVDFGPEDSNRIVNVTVVNDWWYEAADTQFFANLTMPAGCAIGDNGNAYVNIIDANVPVVEFAAAGSTVNEYTPYVRVQVVRRGNTTLPVSVEYATADGTALKDVNYRESRGSLVFDPASKDAYATIVLISTPNVNEGDTFFTVSLSNSTNARPGENTSCRVLVKERVSISFDASEYCVNAGAGSIAVGIQASDPCTGDVSYTADFIDNGEFDDTMSLAGWMTYLPPPPPPEDPEAPPEDPEMPLMMDFLQLINYDGCYAEIMPIVVMGEEQPYVYPADYNTVYSFTIDPNIHEDATLSVRARLNSWSWMSMPPMIRFNIGNTWTEMQIAGEPSEGQQWYNYTLTLYHEDWEGEQYGYITIGWYPYGEYSLPAAGDSLDFDDVHLWFGNMTPPAAAQSHLSPASARFEGTDHAVGNLPFDDPIYASDFDLRLLPLRDFQPASPDTARVIVDDAGRPPFVDFEANATEAVAPMTVQFTDWSIRNPVQWYWDFNGDGINESTEQNPAYTYETPGLYSVTLTAVNGYGASSATKVGYVNAQHMVADFTSSRTWGGVPCSVSFSDASTGVPVDWTWDLNGDGVNDTTGRIASYTYDAPGRYAVTLYVMGANGDSSVTTKTDCVAINPPGQVDFYATPTWMLTNYGYVTTHFIDTTPCDQNRILWDYDGDGSFDRYDNPIIAAYYFAPGDYSPSLTIRNGSGEFTLVKPNYIHVRYPIVADFTANATNESIDIGHNPAIQFTDLTVDDAIRGPIASRSWDFGDGTTSAEKDPVHVYTRAGYYTVSLTVNSIVSSSSKTMAVNIIGPEVLVGFESSSTRDSCTLLVNFTDISSEFYGALNDGWAWDFNGDGVNESSEKNSSYRYVVTMPVSYTVTHYVHNIMGWNKTTMPDYIQIKTVLSLSPSNYSNYETGEDAGAVSLNVVVNGTVPPGTGVSYATSNGTALAGKDYVATAGTLNFSEAETSKVITVPLVGDNEFDLDKYFYLNISDPAGEDVWCAWPNSSRITIRESQPAPALSFNASSYEVNDTDGTVTVNVTKAGLTEMNAVVSLYTQDGTAIAGKNYTSISRTLTFLPTETFKLVSIPIVPRFTTNVSDIRFFYVNLSSPVNGTLGTPCSSTVTIINNFTGPVANFNRTAYYVDETGVSLLVNVTMSKTASVTVTVDYATFGGSATSPANFTAVSGWLTFAPGVTSRTFSVPIINAGLLETYNNSGWYEILNRTFYVNLTGGANCDLGSNATVQINNTNVPTVSFNASYYNVMENAGVITLNVTLSQPLPTTVGVAYTTADGTALAEGSYLIDNSSTIDAGNYTPTKGVIIFTPGTTSQTFTIPIVDNDVYDLPRSFYVGLSDAYSTLPVKFGAQRNNLANIVEDEPTPKLEFSNTTYIYTNGSSYVNLTVVRRGASVAPITVAYNTRDGTAIAGKNYTAQSGTITVNPDQTSVNITIRLMNNNVTDYSKVFYVDLKNLSGNIPVPNAYYQVSDGSFGHTLGPFPVTFYWNGQGSVYVSSNNNSISSPAPDDWLRVYGPGGSIEYGYGQTSWRGTADITSLCVPGNNTVSLVAVNHIPSLLGFWGQQYIYLTANVNGEVGNNATASLGMTARLPDFYITRDDFTFEKVV